MRILISVLLVVIFIGCSVQAKRKPELTNCILVAKTDFWAMYEVKHNNKVYLIVDGDTGLEIIK